MKDASRAARLEQALITAHRNRPEPELGPDFAGMVMASVRQTAAMHDSPDRMYGFLERVFVPVAWASSVVTTALGFYAVDALRAIQVGAMQAAASQTATLLTLRVMGF